MWSLQGWNMIFRRNLNDWEIPRMIELFKLLESFQGIQTGEDYLWWHEHKKRRYKVKEGFKQTSLGENQDFKWPWKQIWRVKVPQKVACLTWLLANEAVLTLDNVAKRGISLYNICSLCGKDTETVKHLFLHCNFTDQLWQIFLNLRGISWSMPSKIDETLFNWEEAGVGATNRERWRMIPACIWWTIWREK
ncbi:hypothetical protein MTR67_013856 [Solanum verrucosum]|uniref:Reverse transcriptase zinc-binding domain-containing protein n=1 Tax=Solanum verrucosum TaxID=315347 RepID=A0AAF0QH03_SOLVR|nr:hypothetical protein MTR67_013856 [Solanum verrucosum]